MKIKAQHGFLGNTGDVGYSHSRRCNIHGWHGEWYICPYYGRALKNQLLKIHNKLKNGQAKIFWEISWKQAGIYK